MTKPNNPGAGIVGHRVDKDGRPIGVADESRHFYLCGACGQAVDMRDLGAMLHHEEPGHKPISADA